MFNPAGLRILVVDDDPLCLAALQRMLNQCHYTVATCDTVNKALAMLREGGFNIVMSEANLPDGDGFELLQKIGLELNLPVIMISSNAETAIVMKGIIHGACDYLVKPIRIQELRNIWQHVVRRMGQKFRMGGEVEEDEDIQIIQPQTEGLRLKRRKDQRVDFSSNSEGEQLVNDISSLKKSCVIWSAQLHKQFVKAVNELGVNNAMPKRVVEIMNVQGLTRENVASHLQKYRLYLKRVSGLSDASSPVVSFQALKDGISTRMRRLNLVSLSEYNTQKEQQHVANRAQVQGALGLIDSKQISHKGSSKPPYSPSSSSSSSSSFSSSPGLHRMCSLDSQKFLMAHPEEMLMENLCSHSSNFAFRMGDSKLPTESQKSLHKKGMKEASVSTSRWIERTYSGSRIQELTKIQSLTLESPENKVTDIVKMEPIQESASSFVSKSIDSSCASSNISWLSTAFSSIPLLTEEEGMKDGALFMLNLNSFSSLVLPHTCDELVPGTPLDVSDYVIDDAFLHNGF